MENIIKAITISFLHSIWQGLVIAAIAGITMIFAKKAPPSLRYNLLCTFFVLFLFCFTYTLWKQYFLLQTVTLSGSSGDHLSVTLLPFQKASGFFNSLVQWCLQQSFTIMIVWLILFGARAGLMIRSLMDLNYIRHRNTFPVGDLWDKKLTELAQSIQVSVKIFFRESALVTQPVVIGILKPLILVPVGLLNHLSEAETEAILLHELAHIRRRDFLVNLLQSFCEAVFFFNPALVWLSNRIRMEREYCCDEMAINKIGSKKGFIQALVAFQQYQPSAVRYAMAFGGKSSLCKRVDHIIARTHKTNRMAKLLSAIVSFTVFVFLVSFSTLSGLRIITKEGSDTLMKTIPESIKIPVVGTYQETKDELATAPIKVKKQLQESRRVLIKKRTAARDTIPKGASKEYTDGYNAGLKYSAEQQSFEERKELEKELRTGYSTEGGKLKTTKDKSLSAGNKKQIELDLQKRKLKSE